MQKSSFKLFFCIFTLIFTFRISALANEHEEAPKSGHEAGKPVEQKDYSGSQNDEWVKIQKDLQSSKVKFENDKKILDDLTESAAQGENISKSSLAAINLAKKTTQESEQSYKRLLKQYNLRFPEKGLDVGRKYERTEIEHAAEHETGLETVDEKPHGVEGHLRKLKKTIRKQYSVVKKEKINDPKKTKTHSEKEINPKENLNTKDVTDQLNLEK